MLLKSKVTAVSCVMLLSTFVTNAHATLLASFSHPQSACCYGLVNAVDGFDFKPLKDINVTALGWYDYGADGLFNPHPVGIYLTETQTLVSTPVIVSSASTLDPISNFRFEHVSPFTLVANTTYTLVGYGAGPIWDQYVTNPTGGVTFSPEISYVRQRSSRATGLEFPSVAGEAGILQGLYFGPNLMYTAVPEPAAFSLILFGGLITSIFMRRKVRTPEVNADNYHR